MHLVAIGGSDAGISAALRARELGRPRRADSGAQHAMDSTGLSTLPDIDIRLY